MKNSILIPVVIIAVVVVGLGVFMVSQNSQTGSLVQNEESGMQKNTDTPAEVIKSPKEETMEMAERDAMQKIDDKIPAESGYLEYSKSVLDKSATDRRVLFFYASWCPTCKPADEDFKTNTSKIPNDVTVIRVNYNDPETDQEEKDLAKKYGITYQHTFVQIDSQGNEITKWNGGKTDDLLAKIK